MHGPAEGDMTPGQLCPHRAALEVTLQGAAASGMGCGWAGCPTKQGWQRGKWHKEEGNGAGGSMLGCRRSCGEGEGKREGAGRGEDSRGGRQGSIKATDRHLSRLRARGRESWSGLSSRSQEESRPLADTHARWQERVRSCPCQP